MAKRKKSKRGDVAMATPSGSGSRHISTSIDEVDNGYVVNVSGEGKNGEYTSKRMIASDKPAALRIANEHLAGSSKKGGKKKGGQKKRFSLKKS